MRWSIRDTVENASVRPEPLMLLYHCNFGYPIVSAATRLHASAGGVEPRDATAAAGIAQHREFGDPQPGYVEQCFYHRPKAKDGRAYAALFNEELGVGAYVRYRTDTLPLLVQWKMLGEQEYVVGLEPGACRPRRPRRAAAPQRSADARAGRDAQLRSGDRRPRGSARARRAFVIGVA